jgi:hypothetical protein
VSPRTISELRADALAAQVALDTEGNAIVIWARARGKTWVIQAAYRPFGGAWQPPRDLSRPSALAGAPQVTFDAEGNALAVWERSDGGHLVVQAASRPAFTGRWSAPQNLSRPGGESLSPQVAVDANGDILVVWARSSGRRWAIESAYRPRGRRWGLPETITRNADGAASPQVVFDSREGAVAAWAALVGTSWSIETAEGVPGLPWHAPEPLAVAGENPRIRLELAVDGRGDVLALWEGMSGLHPVVEAAVRPAARQRWSAVRELSDNTEDAVTPRLAVNSRGDSVAVWARSNGGNWEVQSVRRRAGGSWELATTLSPPGRDAVAPDVALDPHGNAIAVWTRSDGSNTVVQSSYGASVSGGWSPARSISEAGGDAVAPAVAVDGFGNGTLVWSRFDGSAFTAQASGYDAAGPELRELAVPDSGVVGERVSFSVVALDAWSRVAATRWAFGDGGMAFGSHVDHVYASPGRYTVRVTSVDTVGLRTTAADGVVITR